MEKLSHDQLLTYIKKQKIKIKQLETELQNATSTSISNSAASPSAQHAIEGTTDDINSKGSDSWGIWNPFTAVTGDPANRVIELESTLAAEKAKSYEMSSNLAELNVKLTSTLLNYSKLEKDYTELKSYHDRLEQSTPVVNNECNSSNNQLDTIRVAQELKDELQDVSSKYAQTSFEHDRLKEEFETFTLKFSNLQSYCEQLRGQIASADKEKLELQIQLTSLSTDIVRLNCSNEQLESLRQENFDLHKSIDDLKEAHRQEIIALENEWSEWGEGSDTKNIAENKVLQTKIEALQKELTEQDIVKSQLHFVILDLENKFTISDDQLQTRTIEYEKSLGELNQSLIEKESEMFKLRERIIQLESSKSELTSEEITRLTVQLSLSQQSVVQLQESNNALVSKTHELENRVSNEMNDAISLKEVINTLTAEKEKLLTRLQEIEKKASTSLSNVTTVVDQYRELMSKLEDEKNVLIAHTTEIEKQQLMKSNEIKSLLETISNMESEKVSLTEQIQELRASASEKQSEQFVEVNRLKEAIISLETSNSKLTSTVYQLEQKSSEECTEQVQEKLTNLASDNAFLSNSLSDLKCSVANDRSEIVKLRDSLQSLEDEKLTLLQDLRVAQTDLVEQQSNSSKQILKLSETISTLETESSKLADILSTTETTLFEIKSKASEDKEQLCESISKLEAEKMTLLNRIKDLESGGASSKKIKSKDSAETSQLKDMIATLAAEKESLTSRINELENSSLKRQSVQNNIINQLKMSASLLEEEKRSLTALVDDFNKTLSDQRLCTASEINQLREKLFSVESEKIDLLNRIRELELVSSYPQSAESNNLSQHLETITRLENENSALNCSIQDIEAAASQRSLADSHEINGLREMLSSVESEKETALIRLQELDQMTVEYKRNCLSEINKHRETISVLETEKQGLVENFRMLEKSLTGEITQLKETLSTMEIENISIAANLSAIERAMVDNQTRMSDESAEFRQTISNLEDDKSSLSALLKETEAMLSEQKLKDSFEINRLQCIISSLDSEVMRLTSRLVELDTLAAQRQSVESAEFKRMCSALSIVEEEKKSLSEKVLELEKVSFEGANKLCQINAQNEALQQSVSALTTQNHSLASIQAQAEKLKSQCDVLQAELDIIREQNSALVMKEHESVKIAAELSQLKSYIIELKQTHENEKNELSTRLQEFTSSRTNLSQQQEQYQQLEGYFTEQIATLKLSLESSIQETCKFKEEITFYESNKRETDIQLVTLESKLQSSDAHVFRLQADLDNALTALELQKETNNTIDLEDEVKSLTTKLANMTEQCENLQRDQSNSAAKFTALNDKLSRMKALAAKLKANLQNKEKELEVAMVKKTRAKRFSVVLKITYNTAHVFSHVINYCLLSVDDISTGTSRVSAEDLGFRWEEESIVKQWLDEGSVLLGPWPDDFRTQCTKEEIARQETLLLEKCTVESELRELRQTFDSYKLRAQEALRRMGTVENEQKKLQIKEENEAIQTLLNNMQDMEFNYQNLLREKEIELESSKKSLEQMPQLQSNLLLLQDELSAKTAEYEQLAAKLASISEDDTIRNMIHHDTSSSRIENPLCNNGTNWDNHENRQIKDISALPYDEQLAIHDVETARNRTNYMMPTKEDSSGSIELSSAVAAVKVTGKQQTKSTVSKDKILLQKMDQEAREWVLSLREEHTRATVDVLDLKSIITLNMEQMGVLKASIVELEASLSREREFNASNNRINADYLVNVLKKFLLTDNRSERGRLATAITQILHMQPDECKMITDKWTLTQGPAQGIVGWFMAPRKTPGSSSGSTTVIRKPKDLEERTKYDRHELESDQGRGSEEKLSVTRQEESDINGF